MTLGALSTTACAQGLPHMADIQGGYLQGHHGPFGRARTPKSFGLCGSTYEKTRCRIDVDNGLASQSRAIAEKQLETRPGSGRVGEKHLPRFPFNVPYLEVLCFGDLNPLTCTAFSGHRLRRISLSFHSKQA